MNWDTVLELTQRMMQQVGANLMQDFEQVLQGRFTSTSIKDDGSVVTQADKQADHDLRSAIAAVFPEHGVLSEELGQTYGGEEWCWVIDPLDGTNNFARGVPIWDISVGLLYRGTPVFGCLYVPMLRQLFWGFWPGDSGLVMPTGAFLNDQPLVLRAEATSRTHFYSFCSRSWPLLPPDWLGKGRAMGAAAYNLVLVAAGAYLAAVEASPKVWDIAAAWPICLAAGVTWQPLHSDAIFPLVAQRDYSDVGCPTLATNTPEIAIAMADIVDPLRC